MDLVDFIYRTNGATDVDGLQRHFLGFLGGLGIERFIVAEVFHGTKPALEKAFGEGLSNYPKPWSDRYVARHYIGDDPVYRECLASRAPFSWKDAICRHSSPQSARVMDEAGEFGLRGGFGLSVVRSPASLLGFGFLRAR